MDLPEKKKKQMLESKSPAEEVCQILQDAQINLQLMFLKNFIVVI